MSEINKYGDREYIFLYVAYLENLIQKFIPLSSSDLYTRFIAKTYNSLKDLEKN